MTIASGQQALAADVLKHATADGYLRYTASTVLTIASGAVTATANFYRIDTEASAASDDLDTITAGTGVADGHLLVLRAANDARTVVVKHNTGNIMCANASDHWLDDSHDAIMLVYDGNLSKWIVFGFVSPFNITAGSIAADAVTTVKILNANVTTAKLATDSVDDTIAGNRVPQFYRRQGGDATNWPSAGTTTYTPTSVRMQAGLVVSTNAIGSAASTTEAVTFPTAYSAKPLVFLTCADDPKVIVSADFSNILTTGFTAAFYNAGSSNTTKRAYWLAIGPE